MRQTVKTGQFTMDYCRFGSGKRTFVFIPGLSTGPLTPMEAVFEAEFAPLLEEFTVYMFDRRNELPASYRIEEMAEDTVTVLKQLGLRDICLYGTSQGGMIAQVIAERNPELVQQLILASTASRPNAIGTEVIGKWVEIAKEGDGVELNRDMIYKVYSPSFIENNYELIQACLVPMSEEALRRFLTLAEPILCFDRYEDLADIRCRTLVIGCEGDQVFSAAPSEEMAEKLGCESFLYGKEYSHAVYDEAPDCVMRILDFVTEKGKLPELCDEVLENVTGGAIPIFSSQLGSRTGGAVESDVVLECNDNMNGLKTEITKEKVIRHSEFGPLEANA